MSQTIQSLTAALVALAVAHPYAVAYAIAHVVNGMVPSSWHGVPVVGKAFALVDQITAITPPDRAGTFEVPPVFSAVLRALRGIADAVRGRPPTDPPTGSSSVGPASIAGLALAAWSLSAFVAAGMVGLAVAPGCSATQVDVQARASSAVATAANNALPILFGPGGIAEADLRHQLEAACPAHDCAPARVEQIRAAVVEHWRPYVPAHESARLALSAWQDALATCRRTNDDQCLPAMAALPRLLADAQAWRCAVRAAGYPQLDVLPLPAPTCPTPSAPSGGAL